MLKVNIRKEDDGENQAVADSRQEEKIMVEGTDGEIAMLGDETAQGNEETKE